MKSMMSAFALISFLVAAIAIAQSTVNFQAQENGTRYGNLPRYRVTDLGTLPDGSGAFDAAWWVNNSGLSVGVVTLTDGTYHGVVWNKGVTTDLGTPGLGGTNSWAFGVNNMATPNGYAETDTLDPNGEDFCGFGTYLICLGFVWQNGAMISLPTLGGSNGESMRINNRGDVAGYTENSTPDPDCPAPQVLQFKPVIWEKGQAHELPTFDGDREGFAWGISDEGEVVGASGTCAPFNNDGLYLLEAHALYWQNGTVTDLGNLGGTGGMGVLGNAAYSVNNRGDVVGHSDLSGDTATHAFLWTKRTGIQDLGTLPGDLLSYATDINDFGEIVGASVNSSGNYRAVVWERGQPVELNTLIVSGGDAGLFLAAAYSINERGEIVGWGLTSGGDIHAYLAKPVRAEAGGMILSQGRNMKPPVLSIQASERLRSSGRLGARFMAPR